MKHYNPSTVKREHAQATARLVEIAQEIAQIGGNRSLGERHREQLIGPLLQEQTAFENEVWEIEHSHAWTQAAEIEKINARAAQERQMQARLKERSARILAEREAYQRKVDAINWTLVSVPDWAKGEIAKEHIAKMSETAELHALLSAPEADEIINTLAAQRGITPASIREAALPKPFETKATDKLTGKGYVFVTEADGYTYAVSDLGGSGDAE